jgi:hypothetical protein
MLLIACVVNLIVAFILASSGSYMAVFSIVMSAWCAIWTYNPRYQHLDAKDINDGREE